MGSRENTEGKFVVDWIYDEITEIINKDIGKGWVLKKKHFYRYLLGANYEKEKICINNVSNWRTDNKLSETDIEELWNAAKKREKFLSSFFEITDNSIQKITELIDEKLRKYIPNLEEYGHILGTIDRKMVVLIICEIHNNIKSDVISKKYKFYETNGQKERMRELLNLDNSTDSMGKVIFVSGPELSGKHTLVYDVLHDMQDKEGAIVINLKWFNKDIINNNIKIYAEEVLNQLGELQKIRLFKEISITEKLKAIGNGEKIKKIIVVDSSVLGCDNIFETKEYMEILQKKEFKFIFITTRYIKGCVYTGTYSVEELYEMFWFKLKYRCQYDMLDENEKFELDKIFCGIKGKIEKLCMTANGQGFAVELISLVIERYIKGEKEEKDINNLVDNFLEGDFISESLKFRINEDKSPKCMSSHINIIYNRLLSVNERAATLIMSLFGECPVPKEYICTKVNGIGEALSTLEELGWVQEEKVGIKIKVPFEFVLQVLDNKEKNEATQKMEKFVESLIDDIRNRNILSLPFYNIVSIIYGISMKIKRIGIKKELLYKFFYTSIIVFIDLEAVLGVEEMLNEYKKTFEHKKEDFTIECFEVIINWMKGSNFDDKFKNKWIYSADENKLGSLRFDEQMLLIKVIKMMLDNFMNIILHIIKILMYNNYCVDMQERKSEYGKQLWETASVYVRLLNIIKVRDIYFKEKLIEGYHYAIMGIYLMNIYIQPRELERVFNSDNINNIFVNIINYIHFTPYYTAEMLEERLNTLENIRMIRAINILFNRKPANQRRNKSNYDSLFNDELWEYLIYIRNCITSTVDLRCLKLSLIGKLELGAELDRLIYNGLC